ncbi:hypothetical protein ACPCSP_20170 [Streptomyces cinereoruber]|uniref:hypothetical protein n=1 Tax=Streptomyces cinereoruber TaxID=67260 RepID=UPI003C2B0AD4
MTGRSTPRGAYTGRPCRGCRTPIPSRLYLCGDCWDQLPPVARRALNRRDDQATARLRQLYDHVDSGRPLAELEITA